MDNNLPRVTTEMNVAYSDVVWAHGRTKSDRMKPAEHESTRDDKVPANSSAALGTGLAGIQFAASSRGTKRAKPELENLLAPKHQRDPHTLPGQPPNTTRTIFGPQNSDFIIFDTLFSIPKSI